MAGKEITRNNERMKNGVRKYCLTGTSKEILNSGVTEHFILSQLARIKAREITSGVYIKGNIDPIFDTKTYYYREFNIQYLGA